MNGLRRAFHRCVEWIWDWFWAPELALHAAAPLDVSTLVLLADPASRIDTLLTVRQETPPGIARFAALLSECMGEPVIVPADGGLALPAAPKP